jgi:hypothetical protein
VIQTLIIQNPLIDQSEDIWFYFNHIFIPLLKIRSSQLLIWTDGKTGKLWELRHESEVRSKSQIIIRSYLEMAYQILSRLEGLFQFIGWNWKAEHFC